MRLRKVEFENHPILGNFIIDFSIDNSARVFALLVAENGSGKTIFLEEVYKILNNGITLWNDRINRKITIELNDNEKKTLVLRDSVIVIVYNEMKHAHPNWEWVKIFDADDNDISTLVKPKIQDGTINKIFKCAYSTVEINFEKRLIDAIRATTIDQEETIKIKSSPDIATEIAQLLVDIRNQDNSEKGIYFDSGKSNRDIKYKGKFDRFKDAYAKLFDGKELLDIAIRNDNHQVLFRDTRKNIEFDITGLSSGEKQVVYRVGFLLRNLRGLAGGIVLIDEPELSLHPKWQEKYLQFLREVFSDGTGIDMQFIIATHSPLILKGALAKDVSVYMLKNDEHGAISVTNVQKNGFGSLKWGPTWGEICYFAYGMPSNEFHDELYSSIEDSLKQNPSDRVTQDMFEKHVIGKNLNIKMMQWNDHNNKKKNETIMSFVRNRIHHPDNKFRPEITTSELEESIITMLGLINNP